MEPKARLGKLLLERNIITPEQLEMALDEQKKSGKLLGSILIEMGFIDEETIFLPILAGHIGVEFVSLKNVQISPEAVKMVPPKFATYYKIMPIAMEDDSLKIATVKPLEVTALDEISLIASVKLKPVLASEKDINDAIREYYGVGADTIDQMMDSVQPYQRIEEKISDIESIESEASISTFLNQILLEAYRDRATDIHIEPFEDTLQIRYRVDGELHDAKVPSNIKHFKDSINSRIKILSNLNIAEKRIPQDGRFKVHVGEYDLDLRVSFLPTPYGESVVMRLLNTRSLLSFADLGLNEHEQKILHGLIDRPHGIVFLTGPTGSGKTTTLYSCLAKVNSEVRKIITIEDPIEYQLKGITQIQINPRIGLSFAHGLRSMLRHDPDIMMVGEVRDLETVDISIQSALTGHLIFSTLHTNDAAGGVTRLLDMGVEPYLINSTVACFIAQRLIRRICPKCRKEVKITDELIKEFKEEFAVEKNITIYEGEGCESCKMSGYMGREAIYEFLLISEPIQQLIMERATAQAISEKAIELGMRTLRDCGWEKVKSGATTLSEILRVIQEDEIQKSHKVTKSHVTRHTSQGI